jgi:large conductance mechanosensitive channel
MLNEFKAFITRGNVVELAIAVIIGAAFNSIIGSLVNDIITPLILKPTLTASGVDKLEDLSWNGVLFGKFLGTVINFMVVAFLMFLLVKGMNRIQRKSKQQDTSLTPEGPTQEELLAEIRDLLKNK